MMNLHVQDLLNDFEYKVKQGHYKKMDYNTWRELNAQRSSPVSIEMSRALYSPDDISDTEIILIANGREYSFDTWDCSFGEFLSKFMATLKMDSSFNALSAATASATKSIQSSCEALNGIKDIYPYAYCRDDGLTTTSISSNFYEKQPTVEISEKGLKINGQSLNEVIDEALCNSINGKEKDNMDLIKNFDFGSCAHDNVKVSMYGIAVKNANGTWVSYNPKTGDVMDVDILNFDGKYLYKMPVAIKDVKTGDTIIHCRKPVFVTKNENGKILCVDPAAAEEKIVLPVKNMFGFDFVVKIVNLFDGMNGFEAPSADQPFGNNLWMFMMLEDKGNMNDFLPLMLLSNNGNNFNPLMLLALSNDKTSSNDLLPLLLLSQTNTFGQTK